MFEEIPGRSKECEHILTYSDQKKSISSLFNLFLWIEPIMYNIPPERYAENKKNDFPYNFYFSAMDFRCYNDQNYSG